MNRIGPDDSLPELLRGTFRERAAAPPVVEAVADRAIAGAKRVRRNRAAVAGVAAAVTVALASFGTVAVLDRAGPTGEPLEPHAVGSEGWLPTEPIVDLPVDVAVGRFIFLAGGGIRSLVDVVPDWCEDGHCVRGVWRVPEGHLVAVHNPDAAVGATALWHVPEAGPPSVVVDGSGALVVSAGSDELPGIQVVWVDDGRLHIGTYVDRSATGVRSTPIPRMPVGDGPGDTRELGPRTVVGDAVVLAGTQTGGGADLWDVWFPDRGDYVPSPYPVIGLHGTTVDGERLIAWYRPETLEDGKDGCLGELNPEGFVPVHSLCPSPFTMDARVQPSPDGDRWVVSDVSGMVMYDAGQVWDGSGALMSFGGTRPAYDGRWLDAQTFVALHPYSATVFTFDADLKTTATVSLPNPGPTTSMRLVVDLR